MPLRGENMECECNGNCENYGKPGCKCANRDKNNLIKKLEEEHK
jgi:hypothetical protein